MNFFIKTVLYRSLWNVEKVLFLPIQLATHKRATTSTMGCARFVEILQNCVARQLPGRMCSIVFLAFTLKLPVQTLLSVAPTHSVFWRTTQFQQNEHTHGIKKRQIGKLTQITRAEL